MKIKPFHKMRKTWSHDDILCLLSLWNEYEKELKALKRNSHIYDKIAALLRSKGVDATSSEVHFKINNLKQRYRKDELYGLTSWRYFENVKEILQDNKNSSQSTLKQDHIQRIINGYTTTTSSDYSPMQTPPTQTKAFNTSPVYELSSSNSLPHSIPPVNNCVPQQHNLQNSSFNSIARTNYLNSVLSNSISSVIPHKSSCNPTPQITTSNTTIPSNTSSDSTPQNALTSRPTCVVSPTNEKHSNIPPTGSRRKKISLKKALFAEIRRGNDIAARDQEVTEKLLTQANEINREWNKIMKEFMSRSLAILEKNFTVKENEKTD